MSNDELKSPPSCPHCAIHMMLQRRPLPNLDFLECPVCHYTVEVAADTQVAPSPVRRAVQQ
jgi:hypothetical protein